MLRKTVAKREQVVLWVKATGYEIKHGDQMHSLACFKLKDGLIDFEPEEKGDFQFSVYTHMDAKKKQLTPEAQEMLGNKKVNKINEADEFSENYKDFLEFVGAAQMVVFNGPFHLSHIANAISTPKHSVNYHDLKKTLEDNRCQIIDVLSMAKKVFPGKPHDFESVCKDLRISTKDFDCYSAKDNARLLAQMYKKIQPMYIKATTLVPVVPVSQAGMFAAASRKRTYAEVVAANDVQAENTTRAAKKK